MFNFATERRMRRAYDRAVMDVLARPHAYKQTGDLVGLETEVALYSPDLSASELGSLRDSVRAALGAAYELGLHQLEVSKEPVSLAQGFSSLAAQHRSVANSLQREAHAQGVRLLRCGTNPFWPALRPYRTNSPKYQLVPDFQDRYRRPGVISALPAVGAVDAGIVSLCQAFQINVQARSLDHGVELLNWSLMVSPYLLAVSGNGRYLAGRDTGWNDVRMRAWELSHDTRTRRQLRLGFAPRVGLPERYFSSPKDYFGRVARFPFILDNEEAALTVGIGMAWLDARMKLIGDSAVVELRSLPTQPFWEDELALAAFFLGALSYSEHCGLPLLPIPQVAENRMSAMQLGLSGELWLDGERLPAARAVEVWLARAEEGLRLGGLADGLPWLSRLWERLSVGTPADGLCKALGGDPCPGKKKLHEVMEQCGMLV